jgi:hypothetical protein
MGVKMPLFQMEKNKAPRPDGFPIEFFRNVGVLLSKILWYYSRISMK